MSLPCRPEELDHFISRPTDSVLQSLRGLDSDVLVLGAGGKMGLHVSLMLKRALESINSPHQIIAVSRFGSVNSREVFEQSGIETIACDLCDAKSLAELPDSQNIFFLAGVKFGSSDRPELLQQMNIDMPRLVTERFRGTRIVALSTGCVYSYVPLDSAGSNEHSPTDPPGKYARSCLGREQAFIDAAAKHGSRISLIRLYYSLELRYGVLLDIAQLVYQEQPVDISMPYVHVIWQGDAVAQIIRTLELTANPPFILNIAHPKRLEVQALANGFGERLGKSVRFTGQPAKEGWLPDATRALNQLGPPEVQISQIMDWIAAWLEAGHTTLNKPTGFAVMDGKF